MAEWQTIDSAPLDGSEVIVWDGLAVTTAQFKRPDTIEEWWEDVRDEDEASDEPDIVGYQEYLEEEPHGWIRVTAYETEYLNPSHWMPLPAAPSPATSREAGR